jgi:hypothetical protein
MDDAEKRASANKFVISFLRDGIEFYVIQEWCDYGGDFEQEVTSTDVEDIYAYTNELLNEFASKLEEGGK